MVVAGGRKATEQMNLINKLKQLGVSYHFEKEIDEQLEQLFANLEENNIEEECMIAFLDDYKTLVPKLPNEAMATVGASFVSRVNLATGQVVPETKALAKGMLDILSGEMPKGIKVQTKHLEALIELHNMTGAFARNIQHLFSESDIQVLLETLKSVYFPYESFKQNWRAQNQEN